MSNSFSPKVTTENCQLIKVLQFPFTYWQKRKKKDSYELKKCYFPSLLCTRLKGLTSSTTATAKSSWWRLRLAVRRAIRWTWLYFPLWTFRKHFKRYCWHSAQGNLRSWRKTCSALDLSRSEKSNFLMYCTGKGRIVNCIVSYINSMETHNKKQRIHGNLTWCKGGRTFEIRADLSGGLQR